MLAQRVSGSGTGCSTTFQKLFPRACRRGPAGPVTAVCTFAAPSLLLSGEGFQIKAGLGPLIFFLLISSTTVCIFSDRPELSPPQFASY